MFVRPSGSTTTSVTNFRGYVAESQHHTFCFSMFLSRGHVVTSTSEIVVCLLSHMENSLWLWLILSHSLVTVGLDCILIQGPKITGTKSVRHITSFQLIFPLLFFLYFSLSFPFLFFETKKYQIILNWNRSVQEIGLEQGNLRTKQREMKSKALT